MRLFLSLSILVTMTGCSSLNPMTWVAPYHMQIQQGNAVTAEMAARIKPGMTRAQVRFLLGSPLITDLFHANRWDYKFQLYQQGNRTENHLFTVYFNGDTVDHTEASPPAPLQEHANTLGDTTAPPVVTH